MGEAEMSSHSTRSPLHKHSRITHLDVTRLLGDVSALTIVRILETEGTPADLEMAYARFIEGGKDAGRLGLNEKAAQIFGFLATDPILALEEDAR